MPEGNLAFDLNCECIGIHTCRLGAHASFSSQAEGGDGRLPIALSHLEVTFGVRDDVWIVRFVAPAQSADGKLGAPHVRLQLLQRQRSISTRHVTYLPEAN